MSVFHDTAPRVPFAAGTYAASGSDLPHTPTVLAGVGAEWKALQGEGWTLPSLAARCCASDAFSLDGGPGFARETLSVGSVSMPAFAEYASGAAGADSAPLYIFDDSLSTRCFADGTPMASEFSIPACFSADTMLSCAGGAQARPLPPSWLLVGPSGSGTPVHSHPFTVGWCTLLHGTKLWVLLPPHVDPGLLQVGEHNTTSGEEDLSALQWMMQWGGGGEGLTLLQRAGETVFIPAGWFHVVLNVTETVALSHSLYLARDYAVHGMAASAEAQAVGSAWAAGVAGSAAEGQVKTAGTSKDQI